MSPKPMVVAVSGQSSRKPSKRPQRILSDSVYTEAGKIVGLVDRENKCGWVTLQVHEFDALRRALRDASEHAPRD